MEPLRRELAGFIQDPYHVEYEPASEMIITTGVSEGLDIVIRAVTDPGMKCWSLTLLMSVIPHVTMAGSPYCPMH